MSKHGLFRRHLLAVPFELVMLGGAVVTFMDGNWKHFAASLFTLTISFLPLFIEKKFHMKLSMLMQTVFVAFIFSSMFAGEVLGMYGRIWPWDDVTHFISGLLIGLGVIFWIILFVRQRKQFYMPVWFEALTIFCIAVTMSVLWEIAEFASDQLFGTFSQGDDLYDTMMDLTYGMASALIMGIVWVFHAKHKKVPVVSLLIDQFERLNANKRLH